MLHSTFNHFINPGSNILDMSIYQISYNADPDVPFETCLDHIGDILEMKEERVRSFDKIDDALEFLAECSSPITGYSELQYKFIKQYGSYVPCKKEIKVFEEAC